MVKLILVLSAMGLNWHIEVPYNTMERCLEGVEYLVEFHSKKEDTEIKSIRCVEE